MKVGIDISPIVYETGVSWYTRNLVRALLKIDQKDEFVLFGGSLRRMGEFTRFALEVGGGYVKTLPIPPTLADLIWNRLHVFPIENLIGKVDVFHSSDWTQPPTQAYKVTTIHDLVPLRFPEMSHPKIVAAHKNRLKWVKKEVDKIIAVSEFTKSEIVDLLQIDPSKIVIIPEAADSSFVAVDNQRVEETKRKLEILGDYLLVVGADYRKNVPEIIEAFKKLKGGMKLVVIGRPWFETKATQDVIFAGHVDRQTLQNLYSGAQALIYTSKYEGFGLPILEAMQIGCPVVTSRESSMPEVAGNAAVLVNPNEPDDIVGGIGKVLKNRNDWIKKGKERVKRFSWTKTAQETFKVYSAQSYNLGR